MAAEEPNRAWSLCFAACIAALVFDPHGLRAEPEHGAILESRDLSAVRSWGYQLQSVDPAAIARSGCDLIVTDIAPDGRELQSRDLASMHAPGSERPLRLAYLSIGEAEDYRPYWNQSWSSNPPGWLGSENPDWKGNYAVRYWDPAWQELLVGGNGASLQRIMEAGFDGVYLDKVDAFEDWGDERPDAMRDMEELVGRISSIARRSDPGFLIVAQNGGQLLGRGAYRSMLDGFAREDLFFGVDGERVRNSAPEIAEGLRQIALARASGLATFVIEYIGSNRDIAEFRRSAEGLAFLPLIAERSLSTPPSCP